MNLTFTEQIKIIMIRNKLTLEDLAAITGKSKQNLSQQFKRNNFKEEDMKALAGALGYDVIIELKERN